METNEMQASLSESWVERDREFEQELALNLVSPGLSIVEIIDNRMDAAMYMLDRCVEFDMLWYLFEKKVNFTGVFGVNL